MKVLRMTHVLLFWLFEPSIFKILWYMKKLWTEHRIYPVTDYVNIWPPSVTLTFKVGDRLLRMTHRPIVVSNCCKYLQNPFKEKKVMDRTRHIPSNRQCWPWMPKCDLDPGGRGLVVAQDTSSYYNRHFCQVISDTFNKLQSYGPDTKVWRTDGQSLFLYFPFFFRTAGDNLATRLS
jgi:hypothetical protein